jgi:hypothetical protein
MDLAVRLYLLTRKWSRKARYLVIEPLSDVTTTFSIRMHDSEIIIISKVASFRRVMLVMKIM